MAGLGPPLLRVKMTTLTKTWLIARPCLSFRAWKVTHGLATQKANKYPVLNQLIALSETP
jgi:hypothetical protein